eukprot:1157811-Pelagomonas_calceolata.AAC.3
MPLERDCHHCYACLGWPSSKVVDMPLERGCHHQRRSLGDSWGPGGARVQGVVRRGRMGGIILINDDRGGPHRSPLAAFKDSCCKFVHPLLVQTLRA